MEGNVRLHAIRQFYTSRLGLITLEDDVLSIVRQVHQLYGEKVTVEVDPELEVYHFVGHSEDGTDYLIFSSNHLDNRDLERLMRADSHGRHFEDPYDAVEHEQDRLQADIESAQREKLLDAGERLLYVLKKDGTEDRLPLTVAIPDAGH